MIQEFAENRVVVVLLLVVVVLVLVVVVVVVVVVVDAPVLNSLTSSLVDFGPTGRSELRFGL